jgi:16S rRNA (uracil1498-N3)-methyltransferase
MPGSIRLFVPDPLHAGAVVAASPGQAHYLAAVLRRSAGDPVLLFNGHDGEWQARIAGMARTQATLEVQKPMRPQVAEPDVWLLFAPPRRAATELIVEKATELGVALIQPVLTAHTNPAKLNLARLNAIAVEAAEQCERLTVPKIAPLRELAGVIAAWQAGRALIVAAERQKVPPPPALAGPKALLVGPEGGFAVAELDVLRRSPFVIVASLGPRILRAETAAIVGLALLQAEAAG